MVRGTMNARLTAGLFGLALGGCGNAPAPDNVIRQPIDVACAVEGAARNETYRGLSAFMVQGDYVVFYAMDGTQIARHRKEYASCLAQPQRDVRG